MPIRLTYRQIANDLAERIARGEYAPGDQLPSYRETADLYSVSVSTAQRAIGLLQDRGVVRGEPGRGLYVAETD